MKASRPAPTMKRRYDSYCKMCVDENKDKNIPKLVTAVLTHKEN